MGLDTNPSLNSRCEILNELSGHSEIVSSLRKEDDKKTK